MKNNENKKIQGLDFTWDEVNQAIRENRLLSFDLEFSRACNLRCKYCYSFAGKKPAGELSFEEIKDVIRQAIRSGAKNVVNIGGGEPLMYPHYWEILDFERKLGLKSITFTNGTFITKEVAKKLFDKKENIALKLNSFDEKIQDELADVPGTGKKILEALKNLLDIGYAKPGGPELALETVICKQNFNEIEKIYRFCREHNIIPYIEILTEQGRAEDNKESLETPIEDNLELFKKLLAYDEKNFGITWPLTPPIVGQTCKRMLYSAYVTSSGNIQPCPGVEIATEDSNIRNRPLSWILKNSEVFQKVRRIYDNLEGPCKECEHKDCYGCRGTALFHNGHYLSSDPTCWNYNKVKCDGIKSDIKQIKHCCSKN